MTARIETRVGVPRAPILALACFTALALSSGARAAETFCPMSLGFEAGLVQLAAFDVVNGERYELAPEETGTSLVWTFGDDAVEAICLYENGAIVRFEAASGRGLRCEATWDVGAAHYGTAPTCRFENPER